MTLQLIIPQVAVVLAVKEIDDQSYYHPPAGSQ
jgi:hypothetical protein